MFRPFRNLRVSHHPGSSVATEQADALSLFVSLTRSPHRSAIIHGAQSDTRLRITIAPAQTNQTGASRDPGVRFCTVKQLNKLSAETRKLSEKSKFS